MIKNIDTRKQIWIIVGVITLFVILLVIFVDVRAVFRLLRRVDWLVLLVSVIPLLAGYALITTRWRYILANKPAWWKTFQADSIGYMVKTISPLPLAVARVATTSGLTSISVPQATSGMVVERLMEVTMRLLTLIVLLTLFAAQKTNTSLSIL
jgi:uncharacterized membrane protein YbhN (UPF0104 family)